MLHTKPLIPVGTVVPSYRSGSVITDSTLLYINPTTIDCAQGNIDGIDDKGSSKGAERIDTEGPKCAGNVNTTEAPRQAIGKESEGGITNAVGIDIGGPVPLAGINVFTTLDDVWPLKHFLPPVTQAVLLSL